MSIDDLYSRVTDAILRAERLERDGKESEAHAAYLDVSMLEEAIAEKLLPADPECAIARRGAVSAAMNAKAYVRAQELAKRYGCVLTFAASEVESDLTWAKDCETITFSAAGDPPKIQS